MPRISNGSVYSERLRERVGFRISALHRENLPSIINWSLFYSPIPPYVHLFTIQIDFWWCALFHWYMFCLRSFYHRICSSSKRFRGSSYLSSSFLLLVPCPCSRAEIGVKEELLLLLLYRPPTRLPYRYRCNLLSHQFLLTSPTSTEPYTHVFISIHSWNWWVFVFLHWSSVGWKEKEEDGSDQRLSPISLSLSSILYAFPFPTSTTSSWG